jgi:adenosylcobinamide kinase/adenosylcobinamide-phosphate guanylyltransferase
MHRVTLVTGGARSGKSRYAVELAKGFRNRYFIAAAEITDEEMERRIALHRAERGDTFHTVEEPVNLAKALRSLPGDAGIVVVDCLTVWLGNLMHRGFEGETLPTEATSFLDAIKSPPTEIILVTNEVGMGLVPETPMGRVFRDIAGRMNQEVARIADRVILMVSGLPIVLKQNTGGQRIERPRGGGNTGL